jgi:hypothetical protein
MGYCENCSRAINESLNGTEASPSALEVTITGGNEAQRHLRTRDGTADPLSGGSAPRVYFAVGTIYI